MYCTTDWNWFLCMWKSPRGHKVCGRPSKEKTIKQFCQDNARMEIVHRNTSVCEMEVTNATSADFGNWTCHLQEGSSFKTDTKQIKVEVMKESSLDIEAYYEYGKITNDEERILVEDQTRLNITCASIGYPKPSFFWYISPGIHHSNSVMQEYLHLRQLNLDEYVNRSLFLEKVSSLSIMNSFS